MKIKTLSQKHDSCYFGAEYQKYQALYEGGRAFRDKIKSFLTKNAIESDAQYSRRANEACYNGYINSIVNQFRSQLFSSPFVIRTEPEESDSFYTKDFTEDCDLEGSDFQNFMSNVFTTALVKCSSWILAEMPDDEDPPPDNLLDEQERGLLRGWIKELQPDLVFDWEYDSFGQLKWVITYSSETRRDDPRLARTMITETWKIYDSADVETFSITYEQGKRPTADEEIPSLGKRPHKFTRVPLIRLEMPIGLWLVNRLADAQIEHFRMDNALGWAMRRACYPTVVYKAEKPEEANIRASTDGFAVIIGKDEDFKVVSASSESFEVIGKRVATFKDEIHRLALQMSLAVDNSPGALKRSGDSKAMDAQATEICLQAYAVIVKAAVEEIFELISDARGDTSLVFSIEGMDQFNVVDFDSVLNAAKLAKDLDIKSDTFHKELDSKVAESLLANVSQVVKDTIRKEIMTAKETEVAPKEASLNKDKEKQ